MGEKDKVTMLTKKDMVLAAKLIAQGKALNASVEDTFIRFFAEINPKFDSDKFRETIRSTPIATACIELPDGYKIRYEVFPDSDYLDDLSVTKTVSRHHQPYMILKGLYRGSLSAVKHAVEDAEDQKLNWK